MQAGRAHLRKTFFGALFSVVAALAAAEPIASAHEAERSEYGARLHLASLPARVRFASPVPSFLEAALQRAAATWSATSCTHFEIAKPGEEEAALIEVRFVREGWRHGNAIGAHTDVKSDPFTGEIRSAVVEIDATRTWSTEDVVPADAIDLETVLLHELGHAAGLAHSNDPSAVMRAGIKPGQTPRRGLSKDDVAGICSVDPRTWPAETEKPAERNETPAPRIAALVAVAAALAAGISLFSKKRR